MKKYALLLLCCGLISPVANAVVISPGGQITASYDFSGGSYTGPFDVWQMGFDIGTSNLWETNTSINVKLFDSLSTQLADRNIANPFNNNTSIAFAFPFDTHTSDLMGTLIITSVDSNFDLLLSALELGFRLDSDIANTLTFATLSDIAVSNVPIPPAALLFVSALAGIAGFARRKQAA